MRRTGVARAATTMLVLAVALAGCASANNGGAVSASAAGAPVFEVDPFWPKPLPQQLAHGPGGRRRRGPA